MASLLWKVKVLKPAGKLAAGMEVEIVKTGTNAKPTQKEAVEAFSQKYSIKVTQIPNWGNPSTIQITQM